MPGFVVGIYHVRFSRKGNSASKTMSLTNRENQVCALVAAGLQNKEIGAALNISRGTVDAHLKNIYGKLGVHNRTAAALRFVTAGTKCA
jgi:DNA-binding NarL/FixJ family response regulator